MNPKRIIHYILLAVFKLLLVSEVMSQDTISVYFKTGKFRLENKQLAVLNNLTTKYDFNSLDSIHFIGMADSVGKVKDNKSLSMKRARWVYGYLRKNIEGQVPIKILAKGETKNSSLKNAKRVDIILFIRPPIVEELLISNRPKDKCYKIQHRTLHSCHIRDITINNRPYKLVETEDLKLRRNKNLHYGLENDSGQFEVERVKWKTKRTGKLWWKKTILSTTIPAENFKKFKLFEVSSEPCGPCNEEFEEDLKSTNSTACIQVDYYLMDNIQFKSTLFQHKRTKVRVPRELVNPKLKYYYGCNPADRVHWASKNGQRRQHYYYTYLPIEYNKVPKITRMMTCCKEQPERTECNSGIGIINCWSEEEAIQIGLETGDRLIQQKNDLYFGLNINKWLGSWNINTSAGFSSNTDYYFSGQAKFVTSYFSLNNLASFSTWQSPSTFTKSNRYFITYLGFKALILNGEVEKQTILNPHFSLASVTRYKRTFVDEFFINMGYAKNINASSKMNPFFEFGIKTFIAKYYKPFYFKMTI